MICKKCSNDIPELLFPEEVLLEMQSLAAQELKLFMVKMLLMDELGVSHKDAKVIADHLNPKHGICLRCDFDELKGQNVECPECGAFNYNLDEPPFNKSFCQRLEFSLDFDQLGQEDVRGFWCDGVSAFPFDAKSLSKANIRNSKEIITEARMGKDGQDRYRMTIQFGPKALEYYEKGFDLEHCIPESEYTYWIKIDPELGEVWVKLD